MIKNQLKKFEQSEKDVHVARTEWDETKKRLNSAGVKIAAEYETPSGGLHVILNNKNNRNLPDLYKGFRDFDGGYDRGPQSTVHPSEDIKMVLYSNVVNEGY